MATGTSDTVDWQTTRGSIRERNKFMFNNSLLSDVKFAVRDANNKRSKKRLIITAHKYVLAIGSPVFFAMFYGDLAETGDSIDLPDCDSNGFTELLRYLYCDEVQLSGSCAMQVLYLSKKYMVPSLTKQCSKFLDRHLSVKNVLDVLPGAYRCDDQHLLSQCWKLIDINCNYVLKSQSFRFLDKRQLLLMIERATFKCSEVELFKSVMGWASRQCQLQGIPDDGPGKRKVLGDDIVKCIRFPVMSHADFVEVVLPTFVLHMEEVVALTMHLNGVNTKELKFPSQPRESQEVVRFGRFTKYEYGWCYRNKRWSDCDEEVMAFRVSAPLDMCGIRFCGSLEETRFKMDLRLYERQNFSETLFSQRATFANDETTDIVGFDFLLDKTISLEPGQEYIISAGMMGPTSYFGCDGKNVVKKDGVTVTFINVPPFCRFRTSVSKGQFPELIFLKPTIQAIRSDTDPESPSSGDQKEQTKNGAPA